MPPPRALGSTGGTVTSAALVMIAVFSVFATLPLLEFKQLGLGLAAAIALDATIVRGLALPAALTLLGDRGLAGALAHLAGALGAGIMKSVKSVSQRSDRAMSDHSPDTVLRSVVRGAAFAPSLVVLLALIVIWAATGAGYFWPMWVALGVAIPTGLWVAVRWAWGRPRGASRRYAVQASISVVLVLTTVLVWAMSGGGYFWPIFPFVGLAGHCPRSAPRAVPGAPPSAHSRVTSRS